MASMAGMSNWWCSSTNNCPKRLLAAHVRKNESAILVLVTRTIGVLKRKMRMLIQKSSRSEMNVKSISFMTSCGSIPANSSCRSKLSESDSTSGKWVSTATTAETMSVVIGYRSLNVRGAFIRQK